MEQVNRPPIAISAIDYDRLSWIANAGVQSQRYKAAGMLTDELGRAEIVPPRPSGRTSSPCIRTSNTRTT
ncbi:hypothetical protein [Microvirga makkahensis]|uniref:hypothetical protein n=1 Tax=Microvirga makkahensis TaxID=1128670 RepID=UPI0031B5EF1E